MTKQYRVFETASAKWVLVKSDAVIPTIAYTADSHIATVFDDMLLMSANGWFDDFLIYKNTLHAVPLGSNHPPDKCRTVRAELAELKCNRNTEE